GLLSTAFSGYDHETGYLTFRAESPDGLCTFILLAVRPASGTGAAAASPSATGQGTPAETSAVPAPLTGTSPALPLPALILAAAGIVVVVMGAVILKRRRNRRMNPNLFRNE
ncbi:hypothetical protein, partial [Methanoregula sp.]|uniref:hypothetical protein n=1 Tax=Methanoregula sp. TaxID=2052170 RepID=UPI002606CF86